MSAMNKNNDCLVKGGRCRNRAQKREKENLKEIEGWNKLKRFQKIAILRKKLKKEAEPTIEKETQENDIEKWSIWRQRTLPEQEEETMIISDIPEDKIETIKYKNIMKKTKLD